MKSVCKYILALSLLPFAVGCQPEVGSGNTSEGTTENYDDPDYAPSYETEGDGAAGGDSSSSE